MDITTLEYKPSKTRNQDLIEFHAMGDFQLPFQAKNGFDKDPPLVFIQHARYIEIWDIGYYTDYPLTWARGLAHFAYTINELLGGSPLEVINLKDHDYKTVIYDIYQFQHEWLRANTAYHSIVEELIEIGLHK
jgi:hypothetical protein